MMIATVGPMMMNLIDDHIRETRNSRKKAYNRNSPDFHWNGEPNIHEPADFARNPLDSHLFNAEVSRLKNRAKLSGDFVAALFATISMVPSSYPPAIRLPLFT
jgi:hypothetical protein